MLWLIRHLNNINGSKNFVKFLSTLVYYHLFEKSISKVENILKNSEILRLYSGMFSLALPDALAVSSFSSLSPHEATFSIISYAV